MNGPGSDTARGPEAPAVSFSGPSCAVIFGATGGIGSAIARLVSHQPWLSRLYLISRSGERPENLAERPVTPLQFDLEDEQTVREVANTVSGDPDPLSLVIVATGVLQAPRSKGPERDWSELDPDGFSRTLAINTIGPAMIAKHMLPLLAKDRRSVFAALSARVGSISDNRLGGWYSYRSSKAALNMVLRTSAIELRRKNKSAICVGLHPGTVATALSEPFQKGVRPEKLFEPDYSAERLLSVLENAGLEASGKVLAFDGTVVPD